MQQVSSRVITSIWASTSALARPSLTQLWRQTARRGLATSPQRLAEADTPPAASTSTDESSGKKSGGLLKSILHGSEKAKAEQPVTHQDAINSGQHSHIVGRGKYIHELLRHKVLPGKVEEYKEVVGEYNTRLADTKDIDVKLTGSWETAVGELDTFYHIWEHNGMHGLDTAMPQIAQSEELRKLQQRLLPLVTERKSQLIQEFSFWPSSPPKQLGGIYEMRVYDLKPGTLLEWENEWRVGLEARKKFVQPIGAWFAQVGQLHQVIHMWHYESLESRKQMRQRAWEIDTWSRTVAKTVKLANNMSAQILTPLPFSPLR